jgi:transposase
MNELNMSAYDRQKLDVMQRLSRGEISRSIAAKILKRSERQVYRLYRRWKDLGDRGVIHRSRGGHSGRSQLDLRNKVLLHYRDGFTDYSPTLFSEILEEDHGIRLHAETIRRWLTDAGLWQPSVQGRRHRTHRLSRPRRPAMGELLQIDGSHHDWFEGRNPDLPMICLLVLIDDASSRTMLRFSLREDTQGVFELMRNYAERYGLPQAIYSDHGAVYWTEKTETDTETEADIETDAAGGVGHGTLKRRGTTEYQRALDRLNIAAIYAHSPQAKGRVERANGIHQGRLILALRRAGISTIEDANRFLEEYYTNKHNKKFSIPGVPDHHRAIAGYKLEQILCFEKQRTIRNDQTITIERKRFQILRPDPLDRYLLPSPGATITVRIYLDRSVHAFIAQREIRIKAITEQHAIENNLLQSTGRPKSIGKAQHLLANQSRELDPAHARDQSQTEPSVKLQTNFAPGNYQTDQALAQGNP